MSKREKRLKPERVITKRQLSKWQRQKRTQRIIVAAGAFVVALVLGIVGYGYYNDEVKPFREDAIRVNDTVFNTGYYIETLSIYAKGTPSWMVSEALDAVVELIQRNELMRQGALELGISVDKQEIRDELEQRELSNNRAHRGMIEAQLLKDKLLEEHFEPQITPTAEQVKVRAMLLESSEVLEVVKVKLADGEDFSSLAKEFTRNSLTKDKAGDVGWLPQGIARYQLHSMVFDDFVFKLEPGKLADLEDIDTIKNGGYWLIEVTAKEEDMMHVRAILPGNRGEAEEIAGKLEAGDDFAALAEQYSQHPETKDNGGDFGWMPLAGSSMMTSIFNEAISELDVGELSEPIFDEFQKTRGGCWLVEVLVKKPDRQIESNYRQVLAEQALYDWVEECKRASEVECYLDEQKKLWALSQAMEAG